MKRSEHAANGLVKKRAARAALACEGTLGARVLEARMVRYKARDGDGWKRAIKAGSERSFGMARTWSSGEDVMAHMASIALEDLPVPSVERVAMGWRRGFRSPLRGGEEGVDR